MAQLGLPYDEFVQDALRQVVRRSIAHVGQRGFPGNHHFYITFRTHHAGVDIPEYLRSQYAEEMTIVLQNQFYGLEAHEDHFEVTLSFNKRLERLSIAYDALTSFVDPAVNFGLQFRPSGVEEIVTGESPADGDGPPAPDDPDDGPGSGPGGGDHDGGDDGGQPPEPAEKVVSLDAFRKNK